jgi:hypothetical protein
MLKERYGKQKTDIWLKRSRELFKSLYPRIPNIGGKENILYKNLTLATFLMPIATIMKEEGLPTREIGKHLFDLSIKAFKVFLPVAKRISFHEESQIRKMKMAAQRSLHRKYPADWVLEFVEGDEDYLYGYDVIECALCKFWRDQDLEEFVPYMCLTDWAKWELLEVGVERTMTVANGHEVCDFRYCRNKKSYPSGWSPESYSEWTGRFEKEQKESRKQSC